MSASYGSIQSSYKDRDRIVEFVAHNQSFDLNSKKLLDCVLSI